MPKPTARQATALRKVAAGSVQYGDMRSTPNLRRVWERRLRQGPTKGLGGRVNPPPRPDQSYVVLLPEFLIDGASAYGGERRTYDSLGERGWIDYDHRALDIETPRVPVSLTDAGRVALGVT